jgi:hypothetical protein
LLTNYFEPETKQEVKKVGEKRERVRSGNTFSTREMIDTDVRGRKMEKKQ